MTERMSEKIELLLREAAENEMLGGLAATQDERIAHRKRAAALKALADNVRELDRTAQQPLLTRDRYCGRDNCT